MKLKDIAAEIRGYLRKFEADEDLSKTDDGPSRYYLANAYAAGRYVMVVYVTYQGHVHLSKAEALEYLGWLRAGNVGRHYKMKYEKEKTQRGRSLVDIDYASVEAKVSALYADGWKRANKESDENRAEARPSAGQEAD